MLRAIVTLLWAGMSVTYVMTILTLRDGTRAKTGSPRAASPRIHKGKPIVKSESISVDLTTLTATIPVRDRIRDFSDSARAEAQQCLTTKYSVTICR